MQQRLRERLRSIIGERYGIDNLRINLEQPPQVAMGDYATPVAFELARPLRRSPKQIAAELLESLNNHPLAGFAGF